MVALLTGLTGGGSAIGASGAEERQPSGPRDDDPVDARMLADLELLRDLDLLRQLDLVRRLEAVQSQASPRAGRTGQGGKP